MVSIVEAVARLENLPGYYTFRKIPTENAAGHVAKEPFEKREKPLKRCFS
jgi:hypothetical protein